MLTSSKKPNNEIQPPLGKTSIIGFGMTITGEVIADGDIRIDGKLIGKINCTSKVVVGEDGMVEGDIIALQADITGKAYGNLIIKDLLNLRGHAMISGDVNAGKISMEPSVSFNGTCTMQSENSNVIAMTASKDERKKLGE